MPSLAFLAGFRPILSAIWGVLKIGITVPLGLILAAGIWWHFDKGSAVKAAVARATKELVAGAEIAAAKSEAEALRLILKESQIRAAMAAEANRKFENALVEADRRALELEDEIAELESRPPVADRVDSGTLGRLPNR